MTGLQLIQKHKTILSINDLILTKCLNFKIPEDFDYLAARDLFLKPQVDDVKDFRMQIKPPDEQGLYEFLVNEKQFKEKTVLNSIKKLRKYVKQLE